MSDMSTLPRILLVEDDADWQEIYRRCLGSNNYDIVSTRKLKTALAMLKERQFDIVLTDLKMFGGKEEFSGFGVLEMAKEINPDVQVIVITGYGSADHALRAMASGAYDYITKDRELRKKLPLTIQSALEVQSLKQEILASKPSDDIKPETDRIIGNSTSMQALFEQISYSTENSTNVLILGEEGTGKRLIAQTIHRQSNRKREPFWVIDCGSLSESVLESEFFGYEANARFLGSDMQPGKFERANRGTIFLEGVNNLDARFQTGLLTILSEGSLTRFAGQEPIPIDVRVIASTNKNLNEMMADGRFRRGLYDILNETLISVPPLRGRKDGDDILALAAMFLQRHGGSSQVIFSAEAVELLSRYDYPGNVRELESTVKYALAMCKGGIIKPSHLRAEIRSYKQSQQFRRREVNAGIETIKPPTTEPRPKEQVDLPKLRQQIIELFDESELRTLCFDLGIDYQSLEAIGKGGKTRELVDYMRRQNRLVELVIMCRNSRPFSDW